MQYRSKLRCSIGMKTGCAVTNFAPTKGWMVTIEEIRSNA